MSKKLIIKNIINPLNTGNYSINTNHLVPELYSKRKCERGNYIPHTPSHCDQQSWGEVYTRQLDDMYKIVGSAMSTSYKSLNIDWTDPKYAYAFDKLMFNCSSQYIRETESKDVTDYDKEWEKQNGN